MTVKQQAESVLRELPEDCTFEDIQYQLYVLEKIRKAEESIAQEGAISHEEAKKRMDPFRSERMIATAT